MTKIEKEISERLGFTPEQWGATKHVGRSANSAASDRRSAQWFGFSETEIAICQNLGNSPAEYLAGKARRLLGQLGRDSGYVSISASRRAGGSNASRAADEATELMYGDGNLPDHKDDTVRPEALAQQGKQELDLYEVDPGDADAWRHLARAIALLTEAAALCTPPYADRKYPSTGTEDGAAHSDLQRRVGDAIRRVAGPMLEAAAAPGLGSVAIPLRLNAVELEVCAQLGHKPDEYAAFKAQRRVG